MQAKRLFIFIAALMAASVAHADYYSDSHNGWWWYDRQKEAVSEDEKENKPQQPPVPTPKPSKTPKVYPNLSDYTYNQLWDMDPAEFQDLFDNFRAKSVRRPTEDNVKEYYYMSEIARRKALAFANASAFIWQKYPQLSVAADYPVSAPGKVAKNTLEYNEQKKVLQENRDDFALIVFTRKGCEYCTAQDGILKWFTTNTGWVVKSVDIAARPDLAARFGITITPTLIMIQKGVEEYFPVSSGVVSADELAKRTYQAVRVLRGDVTPSQFGLRDFQRGGGFDTSVPANTPWKGGQ